MFVSPQNFRHVEELYDQSLYVRAYHAAQALAPLEAWEGTTARILAGRLAATVGAPEAGMPTTIAGLSARSKRLGGALLLRADNLALSWRDCGLAISAATRR